MGSIRGREDPSEPSILLIIRAVVACAGDIAAVGTGWVNAQ